MTTDAITLKVDAINAEATVIRAAAKLWSLLNHEEDMTPKVMIHRKGHTPDSQLSPFRLAIRQYFRTQNMRTPKSLTPTPVSTPRSQPSPTPELLIYTPEPLIMPGAIRVSDAEQVLQSMRERKKDKTDGGRRSGILQPGIRSCITKRRRQPQNRGPHAMVTRARRSQSKSAHELFDLDNPPSLETLYRTGIS